MSTKIEITEKCAFVHFAVRMFSPEREIGKRDKSGAVIKTEKVQVINPKTLNPLINAKNIGERACRRLGTRFEAMNSWLVPLSNIDALMVEMKKSQEAFEEEKAEFIRKLPENLNAQIAANPADREHILAAAPNAANLESSIRISWVRHNLDVDAIENYGLEREFDSVAEQAAWEIAQDVKTSTGTGSRYSKSTLEVLTRAAQKADSFGFLSESLAALKPAVDKLKASVNVNGFSPADRLMIGAMIAFMSDHKKIINEGRHAVNSVFNSPMNEVYAPAPAVSKPAQPAQPAVAEAMHEVTPLDIGMLPVYSF